MHCRRMEHFSFPVSTFSLFKCLLMVMKCASNEMIEANFQDKFSIRIAKIQWKWWLKQFLRMQQAAVFALHFVEEKRLLCYIDWLLCYIEIYPASLSIFFFGESLEWSKNGKVPEIWDFFGGSNRQIGQNWCEKTEIVQRLMVIFP